jgi:hypothetical protein
MDKSKILAFGITLLVMAALLVGTYFLVFRKKAVDTNPEVSGAGGQAVKISDDLVISPYVIADNSAIWYFNAKGQLFRRTTDGTNVVEYSGFPSLVSGFLKAVWSPSGKDMFLISNSAAGEQKNFFSSSTRKYQLLPPNVKSFDWMPDNQRIVYIWQADGGKSQQLMLGNTDLAGSRVIKNVFWPDLQAKVSPDGKNVLLVRTSVQSVNKIYEANLTTGEFSTIIDEGKNTEVEWTNDRQFLYTQIIDGKSNLKLYDFATATSSDLGVVTNLDKVATDATGEYAYADIKDQDNLDTIWKINISSLEKQKVYQFDDKIQPRDLIIKGQLVFFINSLDSKLYKLTP